jgi:hypothetical protein
VLHPKPQEETDQRTTEPSIDTEPFFIETKSDSGGAVGLAWIGTAVTSLLAELTSASDP